MTTNDPKTETDVNYFQLFSWDVDGSIEDSFVRQWHRRQFSRRNRFIRWLEGPEWIERYEPKRRWGYLLGKIVGAIWR